jgi:Spy/CpxP family protein refolding chaperone
MALALISPHTTTSRQLIKGEFIVRKKSPIALFVGVLSLAMMPLVCHAQGEPGGHMGGPGAPGGQHGFGGPGGGPGGPGGRGGRGFDRLTAALKLTPGQVAKIKPIYDGFRPKMMALRNDPKLNDQQKRAKMQELNAARDQKIKALLSPAQVVLLKADEAQRAKWMAGGGRPGGQMGGPGGHMGGPGGHMGGPGGQPHM